MGRERLEKKAAPLLQPGTCLEPVALCGLGLEGEDETLVRVRPSALSALGLGWHAAGTRGLQSSQ